MATSQFISRGKTKQLRIFNLTADNEGNYAIPPGHVIADIYVKNTTANAVTGGLDIGTTSSGTEIVNGFAIDASAIDHLLDSEIVKRFFSTTARTPLYFSAASAWNSASLDVYIVLDKLVP